MSRSAAPAALHLVLGPAEHGVTRHALDLADAAGEPVCHLDGSTPPTVAGVLRVLATLPTPPGLPLHVHVTDRLLGRTPAEAAVLIEGLAAVHPISVTLHDLPQASDGPERYPRRAAGYRRIADAAFCVQVSSRHEQALLAVIAPAVSAVVVPLPVQLPALAPSPSPSDPSRAAATPTVGVLGYLYPGKGHAEVLAALDRLQRPEVGLVALGGPSDGHEWLIDDLRQLAGSRALEITGYLTDPALDTRIRDITVPVVAPTHVSASASLHRWIGAGRRPVVLTNPYTREVAEALPGTLTLTDDLPAAIAHALDNPADTWLDVTHPAGGGPVAGRPAAGRAAAGAAQSAAIRRALAAP